MVFFTRSGTLTHYGVKGMKWKDHVYVTDETLLEYKKGLKENTTNAKSRTGVIGKYDPNAKKVIAKKEEPQQTGQQQKKERGPKEWESHDWVLAARDKTSSGAGKIANQEMQTVTIKNLSGLGYNTIKTYVSANTAKPKKK